MEGSEQFVSKSAFAAAQGWSPSYVTKLGQQGRLVMAPDAKRVDAAATLALLRETRDLGKAHVTQLHAAGRVQRHVGRQLDPKQPDEKQLERGAESASDPKYWENKARRESALATMAELELAERLGLLVDRKRVEAAAHAGGRTLRDALLGLPTRLAPELASMSDAFEVEAKLRGALRIVLEDTAKMSLQDMDAALQRQH